MLNALFAAVILMTQAAPMATAGTTPEASAAAPGSPGTVSPMTVQSRKKSVVDDSRVVCRKEVVLGTLFPKEVCATNAEFKARREDDQAELRRDTALSPYQINKGLPALPQ
jgi:hypothetical protein